MWTGPRTWRSPKRWRRDDHDRRADPGRDGRSHHVSDLSCWGIFRERTHSPGRESDDAEILRLTAKHLEAVGFQVSLKSAEEVESLSEAPPRCVFLMCEGAPVLRQLEAWQTSGVRQVNDPAAVLNTYRDRMIRQFEEANVPFIDSRVVSRGWCAGRRRRWASRSTGATSSRPRRVTSCCSISTRGRASRSTATRQRSPSPPI